MPRMYCSHVAYFTTLRCSNSHHQSSPQEILAVRGGAKPYYFSTFQLSPLVVSPEILVAKCGIMWERNGRWTLPETPDFHVAFRNLLHAVNLRHGTDGFTSPPKEGVLRIFFRPEKSEGQHPTSRPPKSLNCGCYLHENTLKKYVKCICLLKALLAYNVTIRIFQQIINY